MRYSLIPSQRRLASGPATQRAGDRRKDTKCGDRIDMGNVVHRRAERNHVNNGRTGALPEASALSPLLPTMSERVQQLPVSSLGKTNRPCFSTDSHLCREAAKPSYTATESTKQQQQETTSLHQQPSPQGTERPFPHASPHSTVARHEIIIS